MPYSQDRPRRPSYPSPPTHPLADGKSPDPDTNYQAGAVLARDFLREIQRELRKHAGHAWSLRQMQARFERLLAGHSDAFRAGFLQTLLAYIQLTLEGCDVDPASWDANAYLAQSPPP